MSKRALISGKEHTDECSDITMFNIDIMLLIYVFVLLDVIRKFVYLFYIMAS